MREILLIPSVALTTVAKQMDQTHIETHRFDTYTKQRHTQKLASNSYRHPDSRNYHNFWKG